MTSQQPAGPTRSRGHEKVVFADEAARALLGEHVEELSRPQGPQWQRVKHNSSRTVYRGRIGGKDIYVKHFHSISVVHRGLRRLGSSDAMREMRFSQYLRAGGVATATALAAFCGDGVEWLATRAVGPARRADQWHEQQLRRGQAGRRLIRRATMALARMVGRMHAAGVVHRDLHCGNVLVRGADDDAPVELVLMDLHRAYRRRRLSRRAMAANLAQLYHDRHHLTTRTERLRFLRHYLQAAAARGTLRGWHVMVEHFAEMHTRRQHSQRDRRVFHRNRYFTKLSLPGGWRAHVVLASKRCVAGSEAARQQFTAADWRRVLADPQALLNGDGVEVVKDSPSSLVVRRQIQVGPHRLGVYVKRRRRKRKWKAVPDLFRPARAIRAFALGHALLTRRIATALPMAALERRSGPLLLDSILITEAVAAPRLNEFLEAWLAVPPKGDTPLSVAEQRQLAQDVLWQLGRLLQRLHDNRFAHRDLKATNMLVHWSPGSSPEIVLVDLDGLTRRRVLTARRRFQGLMRLNVSLLKCPVVNRAGRLRMLMGYLRRPGCGEVAFKPYWRKLEEWSTKKLRQQIRSRRRRQKAVRRPNA
jgi:tRNA A-37 threonylcarbamoyl transferase component Bud32